MRLPTTVGIEYTYIGATGFENEVTILDSLRSTDKKIFYNAYNDHCVEVPSPIHRSFSGLKNFYYKMIAHIKKYPLTSHREGEMSGGGHIHLGVQQFNRNLVFKKKFIVNVLRDVTNRPYLTWIFNEWCDDLCAKSLIHSPNIKKIKDASIILWIDINNPIRDTFAKDYAVIFRKDHDSLEFRFFDAKRDFTEVKDHLDFVTRYYKYILKLTNEGKEVNLRVTQRKHLKEFTFGRSVKEFNELLITLGLNPERYKKYIEMNYKERIKHGRLN